MADQEAELLRALQDEHGDALYAHAVRLVGGDRQRAEDLVQETLMRAWRQPEALEPEREAVRSWLFTTAHDLEYDAWQRRSAEAGAGRPDVHVDVDPGPPPAADEADRAVEAWLVAEALDRLTPQHRDVLVECFYRGRSVTQAAARLKLPERTVRSRVHFAMRSLRLTMTELGIAG